MRILLSNDDGIHAQGLLAIYRELKKLGDVWVVAPLEEKSTTGHSLTIHKPLRIISMSHGGRGGHGFYGVSGSPADCVYLGIRQVIRDIPDLVVSGINRGANLGQDVYYSGTVSAAREASILGIRSLAVSLAVDFKRAQADEKLHYESAAKFAVRVIRSLDFLKVPRHTMLNLNVPDLPVKSIRGIQVTRQGFRFYSGSILRRKDHRGKDYYWVGGHYRGFKKEEDTDCYSIESRYASLTPLKLDSTDQQFRAALIKNGAENWLMRNSAGRKGRQKGRRK
ncbi:MAG: 5'/3'-nucleotidase SurE [Bdellovibrionota bacterium]